MQLQDFQTGRKKHVSLVPLVDVVFILLLFFMLTTSVAKEKQLPMNYSAHTSGEQDDLVVREIIIEDNKGWLASEETRVDSADQVALKAWVAQEHDAVYVIDAESIVSTQTLITVLDRLTLAGAANLVLKEEE